MKKWLALILCLVMVLPLCCAAFAEEERTYTQSTYSFRGYSIDLLWEEGLAEDEELKQFILDTFFQKYPAIRETFGTTDDRTLAVRINSGSKNYISSKEGVVMSYEKLKNEEGTRNTLVWFFVNKIINGHPNPEENPEISKLSLGFQIYGENRYAVCPDALTYLPPYQEGQQVFDNHQVTAAFLTWTAQVFGEDVPIRLNRVLHEGCYDHQDFWASATGCSLEELWQLYAASSAQD